VIPRRWRGIGEIAQSGLGLAEAYAGLDAETRFGAVDPKDEEAGECIGGQVLRGERKPSECAAFGTRCTPERPLGVPMVSSEGACAAYHRYRKSSVRTRARKSAQRGGS
jgi:hydrogenase expression/formation protein HypD